MKQFSQTHRPGRLILLLPVLLFYCGNLLAQSPKRAVTLYQCNPCGSSCDTLSFSVPGKCPHCGMDLVKKLPVVMNSIKPSEMCGYLKKNPGVILLDVRTKEEFDGKGSPDYGTLEGAINIPVQQLELRLSELNPYREKEIIVYCSHSQRSPRAAYLLLQSGFKKVTNMSGGMSVMTDNTCKK